jgi:hypothetical protein
MKEKQSPVMGTSSQLISAMPDARTSTPSQHMLRSLSISMVTRSDRGRRSAHGYRDVGQKAWEAVFSRTLTQEI